MVVPSLRLVELVQAYALDLEARVGGRFVQRDHVVEGLHGRELAAEPGQAGQDEVVPLAGALRGDGRELGRACAIGASPQQARDLKR